MTTIINGSSPSITFSDGSAQTSATRPFLNRLINGNFVIDQRNAGASVTQTTSTVYTLDRWACFGSVASKFTVQQNAGSVTPPVGFNKYLGVTSSSAYTVGSAEAFFIFQKIEGFNIADLAWGTANAKTVTLSFQVYSSLTGTFGGAIKNANNDRVYPFSYTVSSANTWTTISVTIAGDTSGTWATDNTTGIYLVFGLGVGSTLSGTAGSWAGSNLFSATGATSVVGTNGATFYITGVQLEVGSTATSFDYRPYGTELALCQRYFWMIGSGINKVLGTGFYFTASEIDMVITMPVAMRASPTLVQTTGTDYFRYARTADNFDSWGALQYFTGNTVNLYVDSGVSGTTGLSSLIITFNASASLALSSEL